MVTNLGVGTDHPFFPPVAESEEEGGRWLSVMTNYKAIVGAFGGESEAVVKDVEGVLGGNAVRILRLHD